MKKVTIVVIAFAVGLILSAYIGSTYLTKAQAPARWEYAQLNIQDRQPRVFIPDDDERGSITSELDDAVQAATTVGLGARLPVAFLDIMGKYGWELIATGTTSYADIFYFKRPIQ